MTKSIPRGSWLLIAVMMPVGSNAVGAPGASPVATAPSHAEVQRVLHRAVTEGGQVGILAEVRNRHGRWVGSAGVADTRTGRKRLLQDRFRVGSITKTFTATVILQLAAEHKLSLDDTVEKWLPGLVRGNGHDGSRITIRHLLNMTSGIFNYAMDEKALSWIVGPAFLGHRFDRYRPEQLVRIAMSHPPTFEPGTSWGYSNTNACLAGMIIERVTGRTLADEITHRITRPLDLAGTYLPGDKETSIRGPHGRHYSKLNLPDANAKIYDVTELNPSGGWAAGGMISTVEDLNRFFSALLRGRLLPAAQQREMFTMVPTQAWIPSTTYGLGISSVKLSCGVTVWGMGGAINGSWSYTYGTRDGRRMVATSVNGDWNNPIAVFTEVLQAEFCPMYPE